MKSQKRKERSYEYDEEFLAVMSASKKPKVISKAQNLDSKFTIHKISQDGNCLFRCILFGLIGDDKHHQNLREIICEHILQHQKDYAGYFTDLSEGLVNSMEEMKNIGVWGTIVELYAASELFAFNFIVYNSKSLNIYCECKHSVSFPTIYVLRE